MEPSLKRRSSVRAPHSSRHAAASADCAAGPRSQRRLTFSPAQSSSSSSHAARGHAEPTAHAPHGPHGEGPVPGVGTEQGVDEGGTEGTEG